MPDETTWFSFFSVCQRCNLNLHETALHFLQCIDSTCRRCDQQSVAQSDADERRALLERCLQSEQQVEEMQGKLNGMRRKLEDAHSALHELGRENQALQVSACLSASALDVSEFDERLRV